MVPAIAVALAVSIDAARSQSAAITPPVPLPGNPAISYPPNAAAKEIEGEVRVRVDVDEQGVPLDVRILSVPAEGAGIEESFVATLKQWRFTPAMAGNVAVRGTYETSVNLRLDMPFHLARMYPSTTSDAAWTALERTLRVLGLSTDRRDRNAGLVVTRPATTGDRVVTYHVFVPPKVTPARAYVGTITLTTTGGISYNAVSLGDAFFATFEKELASRGEGIPMNSSRRAARFRTLIGTQVSECVRRQADGERIPAGSRITEPRKISDVRPVFPANEFDRRKTGTIRVEGALTEDGVFLPRKLVEGDASNTGFVTTSFGATSLWRYQPAIVGGCAVPIIMTVTVSFEL